MTLFVFLEVGFCFSLVFFLGFLVGFEVFFVVVVEKVEREMKRRRWVGEKESSGGGGERGE